MKKIIQSLGVLAISMGLFSCNDKLNIAAPYKNITVVYGLLNRADTAHYIRIQKAFMDENQSAIDMAKVADSSFYNALSVSMKELGPAGNLISTITLTKVDLTIEGYKKDSGAFFNTPNYAYKFKYALNPSNQYRLIILNTVTGNVDSSFTSVIDDRVAPSTFGVQEWLRGTETIDFARFTSGDNKPAEGIYSINIPPNVGAAELVLRFNWTDTNTSTGTAERKFADYTNFHFSKEFTPSTTFNQNFSVTYLHSEIYQFLKEKVGPAEAFHIRYFDSCDMFLYGAGIEYRRYRDLNSNKGGLTADEIKPLYTNIKGQNVMGLFSTKAKTMRLQMPFSDDTKDSLQLGSLKSLNIRF